MRRRHGQQMCEGQVKLCLQEHLNIHTAKLVLPTVLGNYLKNDMADVRMAKLSWRSLFSPSGERAGTEAGFINCKVKPNKCINVNTMVISLITVI